MRDSGSREQVAIKRRLSPFSIPRFDVSPQRARARQRGALLSVQQLVGQAGDRHAGLF